MSSAPPFRQRPDLNLDPTLLTGSPRRHGSSTPTSRAETLIPNLTGTPLAMNPYSPFTPITPANLKFFKANSSPQAQYHETTTRYKPPSREPPFIRMWNRLQIRHLLNSKPIWLILMGLALVMWWFKGGGQKLDMAKLSASGLGKEFMQGRRMQDYQFYPASNPKIHVRFTRCFEEWNVDCVSILADGHRPPIDYAKMEHFQVSFFY